MIEIATFNYAVAESVLQQEFAEIAPILEERTALQPDERDRIVALLRTAAKTRKAAEEAIGPVYS
jgi:hypothetical protein